MGSVLKKSGVVSLIVLVIAAYVALNALYADTVQGVAAANLTDEPELISHSAATLTVEEMQSNYGAVTANLAVSPGSDLLDPITHRLNQNLVIRVRSSATPSAREYTKGVLPGIFPVPLTLAGHVERWPFDLYHSGPIEVQLFRGDGSDNPPELIPLTFIDHLSGFKVSATKVGAQQVYRMNVQRARSTALFGVVICCVLVGVGVLGMFVAVQTLRNRRKFQPPMTTWYAAMLFAVVPLRNALPGSPPFGAWIDVSIVLWVIVALGAAMLLYIVCWWRHLRHDAVAPPAPGSAGSS